MRKANKIGFVLNAVMNIPVVVETHIFLAEKVVNMVASVIVATWILSDHGIIFGVRFTQKVCQASMARDFLVQNPMCLRIKRVN